ncbi:phosphate ABC transporter substrate-binding protein [Shewanella abyssi]|uniref:phosphate ABC transporter substrate-binding protein n=1 Tax=Shewanella abyssi TaxID=311789 RepID=UPI00200CA3F9|nr:phosphate ABC transporter substrate-binding protein [Shewanella abyssi]MCL1051783.1 phosphate ABC transporter substrate-binding protein [Shewanella abyssi]
MKKILLVGLAVISFNSAAGVVVIGNTQGADSISLNAVKNLYLGKSTQIDGSKVSLFELPEGAAERIAFHSKTTGRNDAQLQSNWSRLVFTGKAVAPEIVVDSTAIINSVKSTNNAIAYIDEADVTTDVKVLLKL